MKDMFEFEYRGNPENRKNIHIPMPKAAREEAGLGRWVAHVDYGGQDQGGHDANYRGRQPKNKAQKTSGTTWSGGTQKGYSSSWWDSSRKNW